MRIAMWSGPRNLSTAMMYAFGNRSAGCTAIDEPFYAAYLKATGLDHPMRDDILRSQPNDSDAVIADLADYDGLQYEKHMTHHMLPEFSRDWIADVTNVFLIRHPARVIASYEAKRENPTLSDLGFEQQLHLYETYGGRVVDSADIRKDPKTATQIICEEIGICWDPGMLEWPKGPKPFDGVWASHWYGAVHNSTGIAGQEGPLPEVSKENAPLLARALEIYDAMREHRCFSFD